MDDEQFVQNLVSAIDDADVISIFFPLLRRALVIDARTSPDQPPLITLMPQVTSVEERIEMIEAKATAKGVRTSAQKAGLVCELIRGKNVNQALATLQFTRKTIARELAKVLRSAVASCARALSPSASVRPASAWSSERAF